MHRYLFPILLILSITTQTPAAEITVAKNNGDFTTIQAALNSASPGDTITVRNGVYKEKITLPQSGNASSGYITLQAYTGEQVILDGQGVSGSNMITIRNKNYIKITGLEIRNNLNVNDGSGIRITGYGDHIQITGNKIHTIRGNDAMGITVYGTSSTPISNLTIDGNQIYNCDPAESEALTLNGNINGFQVTGNIVHDVNNIGIDFIGGESWTGNHGVVRNGTCNNNTVYRARSSYGGGYGAGIYVDGGKNITIEANTVYECDLGIEIGAENKNYSATEITVRSNLVYNNDKVGIVFGGYDSSVGRVTGCYFYNNVLYKNDTLRDGNGELWIQYASGNTIKNNIITCGPQNLMLNAVTGSSSNQLDYNLWYGNNGQSGSQWSWKGTEYGSFSAYRSGTGQDANSQFTDPDFIDASGNNFHISLGSPGLNAGDPSYTASKGETDIDGGSRVANGRVDIGADEIGSPTITSPNGGETLTPGENAAITWNSTDNNHNVKLSYSTDNGKQWNTITASTTNGGSYSWNVPSVSSNQCLVRAALSEDQSFSDNSDATFTIGSGGSGEPEISLNRQALFFGALNTAGSGQEVNISNSAGGTLNWTAACSESWISCSPAAGSGAQQVTVSVDVSGLAVGTHTGSVVFSASGASNSPVSLAVTLNRYSQGVTQGPFGNFDSPADGLQDAAGSIALTGWALDDVEIDRLEIYLDQGSNDIHIGNALMVENARTDIEQLYPTYPFNYKAGWGYLMLTNYLPNSGNGTFSFYARAVDKEGHTFILGTKTITCDNAGSQAPFGAIDFPAPGETVSGSAYLNMGWALTPLPASIPGNGSTIEIYVDAVKIGTAVYGGLRSDVEALFPGYANSGGAGAVYSMDTTGMADGRHVLYWLVTDDQGHGAGVGSRFFNTLNGTGVRMAAKAFSRRPSPGKTAIETSPVSIKKGFAGDGVYRTLLPDTGGYVHITLRPLERVVVRLFGESGQPRRVVSIGNLPAGATLDPEKGILYWQPGLGYQGDFQFSFIDTLAPGKQCKRLLRIAVSSRDK